MEGWEADYTETGNKARCNVKVYGLCERGSDCVLDIHITDTGAKSYHYQSSEKVLWRAAIEKYDKYLQLCLDRQQSFVPLVYSVDGMAYKEARAYEKRVASLLTTKWN